MAFSQDPQGSQLQSTPTPATAPAPPSPVTAPTQSYSTPKLADQNPYTDLSYNSFLRGYGLDQQQIQADAARRKAGLQSQIDAQRPVWADRLTEGLKNVGDSAENAGLFRSGQRLQGQAQYQRDQGRQQADFEGGLYGQQQDSAANAQLQLMDLARQRAEQELVARQRLAQQAATNYSDPAFSQILQSMLQG